MDKLEIKAALAIDDAGEITGIAWPYGEPDTAGDWIKKGAFKTPILPLPMLYKHNPNDLIGTWDEVSETDEGLVVKGKLHMDQVRARAVHGLIKGGLVSGLSVSFKTRAATRVGRGRLFTDVDLLEVSPGPNPSHPRARITSKETAAAALAEAITRAAAALKA